LAHFFDNTPELTAPRLVVEAHPAQRQASIFGVSPAWMAGIRDRMRQLEWQCVADPEADVQDGRRTAWIRPPAERAESPSGDVFGF
jgi:hypothetical protein